MPRKTAAKPPWEHENPATEHRHLTPAEVADAKRHAKAAGRPYPNLVDNLREARLAKKKR